MDDLKLKKIIEVLEDNGFIVGEDKDSNRITLETWTDGGVNMIIEIEDKNTIVEEIKNYVSDFDIDEEIDLYRQGKDYCRNFTIRESVEDFEDYEEKIGHIVNELRGISNKKQMTQERKEELFNKCLDYISNLSRDYINTFIDVLGFTKNELEELGFDIDKKANNE